LFILCNGKVFIIEILAQDMKLFKKEKNYDFNF
jgi:hypothetical protein